MIKTALCSLLLAANLDVPAKDIDTRAYYIEGSAHTLLGTVILFNIEREGKGQQRIIAGCEEYNYGLPDISDTMYTAEPDSEMFNLITEACGDIKWI